MAAFKLYASDTGFKVGGVTYNFPNVVSIEVEDPERNRLTRGANAGNKTGLAYKDGLTDPKRWTMPIMGLTPELKTVLDEAFKNQTRLDAFCILREDGSAKWLRNAILSNRPQQLTLDQSAESLHVVIELESFDNEEIHKS